MIFHRRVVDDVDDGTHDGGTVAGDAVQKRFEPALNEQKVENKNMFFLKKIRWCAWNSNPGAAEW